MTDLLEILKLFFGSGAQPLAQSFGILILAFVTWTQSKETNKKFANIDGLLKEIKNKLVEDGLALQGLRLGVNSLEADTKELKRADEQLELRMGSMERTCAATHGLLRGGE